MRRVHVIAVTRDLDRTLVFRTTAGWMLPWFDDNPRVELPDQLHTTLARLVETSDMVHEAPLRPTLSGNLTQVCCVAVIAGAVRSTGARSVSHATLTSMPALIVQQKDAWAAAIPRLSTPGAPFDTPTQVDAALAWARQEIQRLGARTLATVRHRCTRHEYVVRFDTTDGAMYLKAGPDRVADEATLTGLLWALAPRQIPETIATDRACHRWLYRSLPGDLLVGQRLTVVSAATAVRALAILQKQAMSQSRIVAHLAQRRLSAVGLFERADAIAADAWRAAGTETSVETATIDRWADRRGIIRETCAAIDALRLPMTLVPSDFWPRNVLATPDGIGFIDLEQSYWSVPCLPLWRFTSEVERVLHTGTAAHTTITRAFTDAWSDAIDPVDMHAALSALPLLGRLFGLVLTSRELDLEERGLGTPLPLGYRAVRLLPHVRASIESIGQSRSQTPLDARAH